MHNYALDQTLPCCYGTMVEKARSGANQGSGQLAASRGDPISLRPSMRAVEAHYRRGDRGGQNNSHSDAYHSTSNRGPGQ